MTLGHISSERIMCKYVTGKHNICIWSKLPFENIHNISEDKTALQNLWYNPLPPQIKSSLFPNESSHEEFSSVTLFQVFWLLPFMSQDKKSHFTHTLYL